MGANNRLTCRLQTARLAVTLGSAALAIFGCDIVIGGHPIRYEAEDVSGPAEAWQVNRHADNSWNLWSTDQDAKQKWSEGVVLQSPRVMKDRQRGEEGAPVLSIVIDDVPPGSYEVSIGGVGRPLGVSLDNETWKKLEGNGYLGLIEVPESGFRMWIDDRFASSSNPGSAYFDYVEFVLLPDRNRKPKVTGHATERIVDPLDRGVIAMPASDGNVYVGWRLLKKDPPGIAFNVYRRTDDRCAFRQTHLLAEPLRRQAAGFLNKETSDGEAAARPGEGSVLA